MTYLGTFIIFISFAFRLKYIEIEINPKYDTADVCMHQLKKNRKLIIVFNCAMAASFCVIVLMNLLVPLKIFKN